MSIVIINKLINTFYITLINTFYITEYIRGG